MQQAQLNTPQSIKTPKLTVVGAGPGDIDLITYKAVKALQAADVVLYDALVNKDLLVHCRNAKLLYVGKRKGCYAYQQEQIHELIVDYAKKYGHVVRLKGGDPFVFGRGAEEILFAKAQGLKVAVVPGLSSAVTVSALAHIPVTLRGSSESFWVITATTKNHKLSRDIVAAAQSNATVVILMGMHKLSEIVTVFKNAGKAEIPVAIIQNGSRDTQKIGIGTIKNIEQVVIQKVLSSPAIIVIGEVVRFRERLEQTIAEV